LKEDTELSPGPDAGVAALIPRIPQLRGRTFNVKPLHGGLTNRNYRLTSGPDQFVLRIAGKNSRLLGIDRQVEYELSQTAHRAGIGPEVLDFLPRHRALLTRFIPGRVLTAKAMRTPATLRRVIASLRRCHECPGPTTEFSVFDTARRYYAQARRQEVRFPAQISDALTRLDRIEQTVGTPEALRLCHNDLLPSNVIDDGQQMWILDWEYAGKGDVFFDLANLAANSRFDDALERELLKHYFGKFRTDDLRRLRLMRLASDMREAMWGYLQIGTSAVDFDYQAYADRHVRRFLKKSG